jgi:hypothetical protein
MMEKVGSEEDRSDKNGVAAVFDLIAALPPRIQRSCGGAVPVTGIASAGLFSCEIRASQ